MDKEIFPKYLAIRNILQKIRSADTDEELSLLHSEYRSNYKHLKRLLENCEPIESSQDVQLHKTDLVKLQRDFRRFTMESQWNIHNRQKDELFYSSGSEHKLDKIQRQDLIKSMVLARTS